MTAVELGEVAEFINGAAFKPADWGEDGARIIRIQNLNDPTKPFNRTLRQVPSKFHVPTGTLLVSWSASLGVFEWNEPDTALLNQHIFKVVPDGRKVRQDYLRLILAKALKDMEKHAHGSTMLHVNRREFLATKIPLPPLDEQKRIAAILDQADELRRKRQRAIDRLNQLGQAIFHEMFGDPAKNPLGFPVIPLGELASRVTDGEHQTPKRSASGYKLLSARNVRDGYIDFDNVDYVAEDEFRRISKRCLPKRDDILISCSGTIGRTAVVSTDEPFVLVRSAALVVPDHAIVNSTYLAEYLRMPYMFKVMNQAANSSGQPNLFQNQIKRLPIIVPPLPEQLIFAKIAAKIRERLLKDQAVSLQRLDHLFASLQHRAFRGEL